MPDDEKRNEALLRAVLCPTHKLPGDVQQAIEPYMKTGLPEQMPHECQPDAVQLWPESAPFSERGETRQ